MQHQRLRPNNKHKSFPQARRSHGFTAHDKRFRCGFSLPEVVLSIVIASFVITAVVRLFGTVVLDSIGISQRNVLFSSDGTILNVAPDVSATWRANQVMLALAEDCSHASIIMPLQSTAGGALGYVPAGLSALPALQGDPTNYDTPTKLRDVLATVYGAGGTINPNDFDVFVIGPTKDWLGILQVRMTSANVGSSSFIVYSVTYIRPAGIWNSYTFAEPDVPGEYQVVPSATYNETVGGPIPTASYTLPDPSIQAFYNQHSRYVFTYATLPSSQTQ